MPGRVRERYTNTVHSYWTHSSSSTKWNELYYSAQYENCEDVYGDYGGQHDFTLQKDRRVAATLDGGSGGYTAHSLILQPAMYYVSLPSLNISNLATALLEKTNPARPHVSLPNLIVETIQGLPQLIKIQGDNLLQRSASGNLNFQFGWKPLISDLKKLNDFQSAVDRRMNEINRLHSKGGLKRRMDLGSTDASSTLSSRTYKTSPSFARCGGSPKLSGTRKYWGTVRWLPVINGLPKTDPERTKEVRKILLGVHSSQTAQNVWNILPWSWLFDWFVNVGGFLQATNNSIAHAANNVCIMVHSTYRTDYPIAWQEDDFVTFDPTTPYRTREFKVRRIMGGLVVPEASLPALSSRQASILGSLAALRGR